MKVRFSAEVVATEEHWWALSRILDSFEEGRHLWDVEDLRAMRASPWMTGDAGSREASRRQELFKKLLMRGLQRGVKKDLRHSITLTVSTVEAPPTVLLPTDALKALGQVVHVVVENAESDRAFLTCMMQAFGRDVLLSTLDHTWELVSAGGCGEIPKRVAERVGKIGKGPRRVLIISDSDRMVPGERSKTVEQIELCAREYGVQAVILNKREIENYIPVGALQRVGGRDKYRDAYVAFTKLSDEQQDHYDMKEGFKRDKKTGEPVIPDPQEAMFSNFRPRRLLSDLCGGFGSEVWRLFEQAADVIDEDSVTKHCTPTDPDAPGARDSEEIPRMLDAIERLL